MTRDQPVGQELVLSNTLSLPLSAVTETFSFLGKRGSGKTHAASVLVEEMLKHRQCLAVIDPLGVWWGLRSAADGNSEGFPVVIFGGEHGDLPLEPGAGELIANLVVDNNIACVIDLSLMRKSEQRTFMTAFTETLFLRNREPLHLVVDEADLFAGQRPPKGAERLLGAMEDLVRRGRSKGIGLTLITQRPAVIHKDVLSQTSVLVALRLVSPHDAAAVDAWIKQHDSEGHRKELLESLPTLPVGTAWVWSPGTYGTFAKVAIRPRETFDSSATPVVGQAQVAPRQYARVDLDALRQRMTDVVEREALKDPSQLRKRVAELERELAHVRAAQPVATERVVEVPVTVEVPVFNADDTERLEALRELLGDASQALAALLVAAERVTQPAQPAVPARSIAAPQRAEPLPNAPVAPPRSPSPADDASLDDVVLDDLPAGAERLITTLVSYHPETLTRPQAAALADLSHRSGTFAGYLAKLRRLGLVDDHASGRLGATPSALAAFPNQVAAVPQTRDELRALWAKRLPEGANRMLDAVLAAGPAGVGRDELAEAAGLSPRSGTFAGYLAKLRQFSLVEGSKTIRIGTDSAWSLVR